MTDGPRLSQIAGGEPLYPATVELTRAVWDRVGILATHHHTEPAAMIERLLFRSLSSLDRTERTAIETAATPPLNGYERTGWPPRTSVGRD